MPERINLITKKIKLKIVKTSKEQMEMTAFVSSVSTQLIDGKSTGRNVLKQGPKTTSVFAFVNSTKQ